MPSNVTIKIGKVEFSMGYQCAKCQKMRPVHMFIGTDGKTYKTCELCRSKRV